MSASPYTLFAKLQSAKNALEDALIHSCGAATAHAEAKRSLELSEAVQLHRGIEGANERQRAARLRLELSAQYTALAETEDALTEARCRLECARLEWDLQRYCIRALEVPVGLAA